MTRVRGGRHERVRIRTTVHLALAVLCACAKPAPIGGVARAGALVVANRTPTQCTDLDREAGGATVEVHDPHGCNASVRFDLDPAGYRDVALPFFRDEARPTSSADAGGGSPRARTVVLRDPTGQRGWTVELSEQALPWTASGRCARPSDPSTFDMDAWRLLVLRVRTLDALGTTRPLVEAQADTLAVRIVPRGAREPVNSVVVRSTTSSGVWAVAWCADGDAGPYEVGLDVRGAYQLEEDRFTLPDLSRDTYTVLRYLVRPIVGEDELP